MYGCIEIHPSRLASWRSCERRAMWEHLHPESKPFAGEHIAGWIGSAVHARLAGEDLPVLPEPALFDDRTPTEIYARAQVNMLVTSIEAKVDPIGWKVLARELPVRAPVEDAVIAGTCDLVVDTGLGKAVLDVKTGHSSYHSWLQLGAYAAALDATEDEGPASVGLISCPRPRVGRPVAAQIEFRPSGPAKTDAAAVVRRVIALFNDGSEPAMSSSAMAEMIVTVSNVLGVERAEIPLPKAAPLGVLGPNSAGKTSLATAIGAVLSREANPLGLAPTARPYLRQGADYGEVLLSGPGGTEYVRWVLSEKAMRVFAEAPEPLHPAAVGLTDFISRASARARGEIWESAFLPPPEQIEDELKKELRSALAGERMVSDVIDILREQGWESVEGVYRAKAKESKREWSSITGEPYGTSKAPNWTPPGWRSDYDGVTPLEAEAALGDARDALQALHVSGAVSAAEAQQAKDAAEKIPELRERKDEAARRLEEAGKTAAAVEGEIAGIRADGFETKNKYEEHQRSKPKPSDGRPCPLCGGKIVVRDRALYAAEDEAAFAERIKDWGKRGEELGDSLDFLRQKLAAAKRKGRPILEQRERAENVKADADADLRAAGVQAIGADSPLKADESEERIALAEQELESRREALELIRKRSEATEAHRSVSYYALIAELLGPRGIRGRAMKAGLERLAKGLGRVHELTNWPLVKLDPSYAVSAGERPVALCSTSEQWRAQTALQIALALALDNNYAVLDGADVLDAQGLSELGVLCDSLAAENGLSLVVCATGGRELFPDRWATVVVEEGRIAASSRERVTGA